MHVAHIYMTSIAYIPYVSGHIDATITNQVKQHKRFSNYSKLVLHYQAKN